MKKFQVIGSVTVSVYKEVWANSESEAYDKAYSQLSSLTEYAGNGGWDRLIGVENDGESVSADGVIEYNDIAELEDDPDYHECPECGEELYEEEVGVWYCEECDMYFNADGEEIDEPCDDEEDEEE